MNQNDIPGDAEYWEWVELRRRALALRRVCVPDLSLEQAVIAVCLHDIAEALQPEVVTIAELDPEGRIHE